MKDDVAGTDAQVMEMPLERPWIPLVQRCTSLGMLRGAALCGAIGWVCGLLAYYVTPRPLVGPEGVVVGRDFMAFYIGGTLVSTGAGDALYSPTVQQRAQDAILAPERLDGLAYYINPAPVAVFYSVLAHLPYLWALHLHTALMLGILVAGLWLTLGDLSALRPYRGIVVTLCALWLPMAQTITGGQNAALTVALTGIAWWALRRDRQALAGLALGVLLFKPQYAVPLLGLVLLRGAWRTVTVAAVCGAAGYAVGAVSCGWDWPAQMVAATQGYHHDQELLVSGATHVSLLQAADFTLAEPLRRWGWSSAAGFVAPLAMGVVAALCAGLVFSWRRVRWTAPHFDLAWAQATGALLLISPHAQNYDVAILIVPLLLLLNQRWVVRGAPGPALRWALLAAFALYPLYGAAAWVGVQPLLALPIWLTVWATLALRAALRPAAQQPVEAAL